MRPGFEIPTIREPGVAKVVVPTGRAPTIHSETVAGPFGRPGDGHELQFLEHFGTRNFYVYSTPVRVAQSLERVHAVFVVQIVPVKTCPPLKPGLKRPKTMVPKLFDGRLPSFFG